MTSKREIDAALDLIAESESPESVQAAHRAMVAAISEWDYVSSTDLLAAVESSGAWWVVRHDLFLDEVIVTRHASEEAARAELRELTEADEQEGGR